ncbi:MAG: iron chelate uptake ABC transporter family permease subunit, partial [Gemmatimonadales bacterium]
MIAHRSWHWWGGIAALAAACILGVSLGTVQLSLAQVASALTDSATPSVHAIVVTLRLPRVVLAALVGVALGTSGATLQATLRNPLAEPYLLGVSGGAAVGAVAAMMLGASSAFWPLLAFTGAGVAVILAIGVARGAAVLLVSHQLNLVARFATSMVLLY